MLNPQAIEYFRQAHGIKAKNATRIDFDKTPDPYHYIAGIPSEPVIPDIDQIARKAINDLRVELWIQSALVSHYRLILVRLAIIRAIKFPKIEREIKNTRRARRGGGEEKISPKIGVPVLACGIPQHHPLKTESYLIRLSTK